METKPGIYTTEFWLTILTHVMGLVNLFGLWNYVPNKWSVILMAIVQAGYSISRGQAKSSASADPTNPNTFRLIPKRITR